MGSSGGVVIQPALGRAADVWSYGTSYLLGAAVGDRGSRLATSP